MTQYFRGYKAEGTVGAYRIVKHGSANQTCVVAAAATDKLVGTSDALAHVAGDLVDVDLRAVCEVVLGGTVARGDPLTSDASGAAVAAAPAAGSNVRIIGFADMSGVAGDVITYLRAPGVLQG